MGAQTSKSSGPAAEPLDARVLTRAWREGVPFTLLRDQGYVSDKIQELATAGRLSEAATKALEAKENEVTASGLDEAPLDEIQQAADLARTKLFTRTVKVDGGDPTAADSATDTVDSSPKSPTAQAGNALPPSDQASSYLDRENAASALEGMKGNPLSRDSHVSIADETLRVQRAELVRNFFAQLAAHVEASGVDAGAEEAPAPGTTLETGAASAPESSLPLPMIPAPRGINSSTSLSGDAPPLSMFSMGSFRLQLEMLREFRVMSPRMFEKGALAIVQTVLDFAPFALHEINPQSPEETLLKDVHAFCRDFLKTPGTADAPLVESQRQVLLLLLLAFGVTSGRVSLLLEFVEGIVSAQTIADKSDSAAQQQRRAFYVWANAFIERLLQYRLHFGIGTLESDTLVNQVPVKAMPNEDKSLPADEATGEFPSCVAADGSYVYTWSASKGLAKVGTGLNFTVAGKVYAEAPVSRFVDALRSPSPVYCALVYGLNKVEMGVADVIREEVKNDRDARFVRDIFANRSQNGNALAASSSCAKLLVVVSVRDRESLLVFEDTETFNLASRVAGVGDGEGGVSPTGDELHILSAFYGDFHVLSAAALAELREKVKGASLEASSAETSEPELSSELLSSLLSTSGISSSGPEEIVAIYEFGSKRIGSHTLRVGEQIKWLESYVAKPHNSSLVVCGDSLYLHLLLSEPSDDGAFATRDQTVPSLIRIEEEDLSVAAVVRVGVRDRSQSPGRISTFITEGKFLYEITALEDSYRVQVFAPKLDNSGRRTFELIRHFVLDLSRMLCPVVKGAVRENRESDEEKAEWAMPAFYTNGVSICMVVPEVSDANSSPKTTVKTHCALFNAQNGQFENIESAKASTVNRSTQQVTKTSEIEVCFERHIPTTAVCFDGRNNLIWLFNNAKNGVLSYQNTGHRICMNERSVPADRLAKELGSSSALIDVNATEASSQAELASLLVLGGLYSNVEASSARDRAANASASSSSNKAARSLAIPFVADLEPDSLQSLLNLTLKYSQLFRAGKASRVDCYCLQSCFGVLDSNIEHLLASKDGERKRTALAVLQKGLSEPLENILQLSNDDCGGEESGQVESRTTINSLEGYDEHRARLMSVTLDLYTTSMRIFHADVSKHLSHILKYLRGWEQGRASSTELEIMTRLLLHVSTRMNALYRSMATDQATLNQFLKIVDCAVEVQKRQVRQAGSTDRQELSETPPTQSVADREASAALVALVNSIAQLIFTSTPASDGIDSSSSNGALEVALSVYEAVCDACCGIVDEVSSRVSDRKQLFGWPSVENALKTGFVGVLAPVVLSFGAHLLRQRDVLVALDDALKKTTPKKTSDTNDVSHELTSESRLLILVKSQAAKLKKLVKGLDDLVSQVDPSQREVLVEGVAMSTISETMESEHEYGNNLDVMKELRVPGAIRLVVTFDPKTRTENNYDYLTFFKDKSQSEFYGNQTYSGRDAEHNWPGLEGNPPLIIDSDHCFVMFHTDSSNTDWGYRFTATGELLEKKKTVQQHWLCFLLETAFQVLDESVKLLVDGSLFAPIDDVEISNDRFLRSDLLKSGVCTEESKNAKVLQLLQEFVDPSESSDATRLLHALSERSAGGGLRRSLARSTSFQEIAASATNTSVNRAVRAATAAILHHNMWGMDAYAFAQDLRSDVSEQVLRGWKNAQKMRDWFYLGDAAEGGIHAQGTPRRRSLRLRRQPSAFKGMSEESLQILCDKVIERAKFLLELTPASFSFVSGAKRRWGLLAKYGSAIRKLHPSDSPLEKWYNLLDELHAATELRSLFQYRRSSSERLKAGQAKSVTEQVLEFIQSDVDVNEIRKVIAIRNTRAMSRSFGLALFVEMLESVSNVRLQSVMAENFAAAVKKAAFDHSLAVVNAAASASNGDIAPSALTKDSVVPRIHLDVGLLGCDEVLRQHVSEGLGRCLSCFSNLLGTVTTKDSGNAQSSSSLVIAILKASAMDYELEDSCLLHDCRILSQLFRLLSSESIGVRRAAQSLLSILLSRFVAGKASPESPRDLAGRGDKHDAAAFQRQLFTAVGLQLEGAVSGLQQQDSPTDDGQASAPQRFWYLPANSPGLTAAATKSSRVQWNHSIMLWVYVSNRALVYALKAGDKVRRGPDWKEDSNDDAAEEGEGDEAAAAEKLVGTVVSVASPTSVMVKWANKTSEARFDPKRGIFDVVLVDEGLGGVIFFKGNKNLTTEDSDGSGEGGSRATPWSHFGLFLSDNRQLSYRIACTDDKESVYETNYELDADEWAHVAVVQDHSTLRIFVNGTMASQHVLDPFLLMDGNVCASECKIVESVHPLPNSSLDQYWPVQIPGTTKIRVTFDPMCDVDGSTGYVRLYKDTRCDEYWGEAKYAGKYSDPERNFPGAQSNRSRRQRSGSTDGGALVPNLDYIEVPGDNFLVYFHAEGSSTGWGFRLLASPIFPVAEDEAVKSDVVPVLAAATASMSPNRPTLNPYPFYFGEPPGRVMDAPAAKVWVYEPKVFSYAVTESDLVGEIQGSCPSAENAPAVVANERILYILGLIRSCAETQYAREQIATPKNIGFLMSLAFNDQLSTEVRSASLRVLRDFAGLMTPAVVESEFLSAFAHADRPFVTYVFECLSEAVNVWQKYRDDEEYVAPKVDHEVVLDDDGAEDVALTSSTAVETRLQLRPSAQGQASLIASYVSLLRSMASSPEWATRLAQLMVESVQGLGTIYDPVHQSEKRGQSFHNAVGAALATFALLGGSYDGAYLGGRVKCCVNIDGKESIESGYLIEFRMKNGAPSARVLFDCDGAEAVDVPLSDIAHLDDEEQVELERFVRHLKPFETDLANMYQQMLQYEDVESFSSSMYKTKISKKESAEILESEHPYAPDEDVTYQLKFLGVNEIVVRFDKLSSLSGPTDYIQFRKRKDEKKSDADDDEEYWGEEKYFGTGAAFPGVGDTPPLRIPASAVDVHFHSESSSGAAGAEWGFKLSASAFESVVTLPPEMPPTLSVSALNDLRTRCVKSIGAVLRTKQAVRTPLPVFSPLLPSLVTFANAPSIGRPTQALAKTQAFESKHPYANSVQEYMAVTFSGASKLTITFDSQSRTEQGCDYVCFFKDKSLSERWGAYQYCGIDSNANWPGTGGRPPLVITNDSFTLLWCTDASNVDWGWKFTVTAEFPPLVPMQQRLDQLDSRAYDAFEALYEKMETQRVPSSSDFSEFEKFADSAEAQRHAFAQDPIRKLLAVASSRDDGREHSSDENTSKQKRLFFRVVDENSVPVYKTQDVESEVLRELSSGVEFEALSLENGWVQVLLLSDETESEAPPENEGERIDRILEKEAKLGWICQRTGDRLHVARVESFAQSEELLTLGVDDESFEPKHSNFEMDENNADQERLTSFCSPFSHDGLKGQMDRLQSLALDTHRAMTTKAARRALLTYLACSADSAPARWSDFGGPEEALLLFSHYFVEESAREVFDNQSTVLDALASRLQSMLTDAQDDAATAAVLQKCFDVIQSGVEMVPKGRGALRVLESPHPYHDNMDQYWPIEIPGAKKIKIVFDRQSKTESGCDYIAFYQGVSDREEIVGPSQISGRADNQNWPGFGGRPPLVIDGDACEAYFHSDASQNDWGFKLYAIGIFEEEAPPPCFEKDDSVVGSSVEDKSGKLAVGLLCMAFWFLSVVSSIPPEKLVHGSAGYKVLRSPDMIQALILCLEVLPQRVKLYGLHVITSITQSAHFHAMPAAQVEELRDVLIAKLRAQHLSEERVEAKSPYLQTLIDCAAALDLALDSRCFPTLAKCDSMARGDLNSSSSESDSSPSTWRNVELSGDTTPLWISDKSTSTSGVHQFRFVFHSVKGPVTFMLFDSTDAPTLSAQSESPVALPFPYALQWNDIGELCVRSKATSGVVTKSLQALNNRIADGDTITLQVDFTQQTLLLRKNSVLAAVIAGPSNSRALISWSELPFEDGHPPAAICVGLKTAGHADGSSRIEFARFEHSLLALVPSRVVPGWYNKVVDAMGMLLDFSEDRASKVVTKESTHPLPARSADGGEVLHDETIKIDGAVALEIRVDCRTKLNAGESLAFFVRNEKRGDPAFSLTAVDGEKDSVERPSWFAADPNRPVNHLLRVGNAVVRSMDWEYGDEDGGPGSVGIVEELCAWGGHSGAGVRVKWSVSGKVSLYRYGFRGAFDVQKRLEGHELDPPLVIPGNALSFEHRLQASSGETALDTTALPLDLNAPSATENSFYGSLHLDGTSQLELQITGSDTSSAVLRDLTLELWLRLENPSSAFEDPANPSRSLSHLEVLRITSADGASFLALRVDHNGRCALVSRPGQSNAVEADQKSSSSGGDGQSQGSGSNLRFNAWLHLAVVCAGSSVGIYQNANLVWSTTDQSVRDCLAANGSSRLVFGASNCNSTGLDESSGSDGGCAPLRGHLYDVRIWDAAYKSEQLRSHVVGLESVEASSEQLSSSRPGTPSRGAQAAIFKAAGLGSPRSSLSSPRSPRSPSSRSLSLVIPTHMKQWVTVNRSSARDLATVRLNSFVRPPIAAGDSSITSKAIVYYEAHALTNGKLCVGWIADGVKLQDSRTAMIGEAPVSFGIEPSKRLGHFAGSTCDLAPFSSNFAANAGSTTSSSGFNSPRARRGSDAESSNGGSFFSDVFCRQGDVIGCALRWDTHEMLFYVNGVLVAQWSMDEEAKAADESGDSGTVGSPSGADGTSRVFDELVDEMVSMGFSRQSSTNAVSVSGAKDVPAAVDWLLTSSTDSTDSTELGPPPSQDLLMPPRSPSLRASRSSQGTLSPRRRSTGKTAPAINRDVGFAPAASLGAQGAQGLAWNFGQQPFKFEPTFGDDATEGTKDGDSMLTVLQATTQAEDDAFFEVFDHTERQWERIVYRHHLQDLSPRLTAWWKLDEGSGSAVEDAACGEVSGAIVTSSDALKEAHGAEKFSGAPWWDASCEPPAAARRHNDESSGASSQSPFFFAATAGGDTGDSSMSGRATTMARASRSRWGYRFYVIPHFTPSSIGRRRFQSPTVRFCEPAAAGLQARHDRQLIKYVNKVAQAKQLTATQVLRVAWSEIAPDSDELVRWPVLVEIATGVTAAPASQELPPPPAGLGMPPPSPAAMGTSDAADTPEQAASAVTATATTIAMSASARTELNERLAKRFKLLQEFNSAISRVLPLVQFDSSRSGGDTRVPQQLGELVAAQRQRIFSTVKRGVWDAALARTSVSSSLATVEVTFNRPKAMRHRATRQVDADARATLFSQAFRQLNALDAAHFRRSDNLYHVTFLGENAQDAGGPYRETLAQFCEELESAQLPLLLPTSNAQHNVGAARDKWVLNPGASLTSPTMAQLLEFLGKLLGAALRSKHYLALHLAVLVWKPLVGERVTLDDLASVDSMIVNSMRQMRTIDTMGVTEEMFEDIVMEVFTTLSTDNRVIELTPGGASRAVTFASRAEYADLVEQYRLHEGDAAAALVRRGIAKVVPAKLLALFTGAELETMVCGTPEVDVDLLQRCTEYSGCNSSDTHVEWFWNVLRGFTQEERSAFLRFVWGRARLPANDKEFPQLFKLQSFSMPSSSSSSRRRRGIDDFLPVSHTCFFSLELPAYTSEAVLREKLRYAIYNCQEIDGDGDSVAANQLGWEE